MTTYKIAEVQQKVQDLYLENLGRAGEPAGVDYYVSRVTNGATMTDVDAMMEASPEYMALHGATGGGPLAGNGRTWLLLGVGALVVFIVVRRMKK